MALRAFLFSADGTATSDLCQILTDLGIEAEVCSEMLVAVERITGQPFDALIVDWDLQTEAMFLIKSVRDLKSAAHILTLAMVQDDAALPEALQAGANSAIRKPINPQQTHDTLATAKQLILAQHNEQREKADRLAAVHAATNSEASAADEYMPTPEAEEPGPKSGFLEQTAPKSALEAQQSVVELEPPEPEPPAPPPAPDPDARARALRILGYGPQVPAPNPAPSHPSPRVFDFKGTPQGSPRDSAGVFSSFPEPPANGESEAASGGRPRYGLYALVAALLLVGALWVFLPKSALVASVRNFAQRLTRSATRLATANTDNTPVPDLPPEPVSGKPVVSVTPDPEIVDAEDDAAAKVQVIESKPIPAPGAQQPPPDASLPDLSSGQSPVAAQSAAAAQALSPPQGPALIQGPPTNSTLQPTIQSVSAQPPPSSGSAPPAPPVAPTPAAPAPTTPASHAPEEGFSANLAPHASVIIPDSLKTSPAPAPASNLEPPNVPEEISRAFVIKRVDPQYPPVAVQQRLDGLVVLQVHVGKDGAIRDLKLIKGYFVLGRAAFEAVRQWRFRPYVLNGKVTEFQTYVTVSFKLPG